MTRTMPVVATIGVSIPGPDVPIQDEIATGGTPGVGHEEIVALRAS